MPINHLTPYKTLLLTLCRGNSAAGVCLLDTVVHLTSEVSTHKLPQGPGHDRSHGWGRRSCIHCPLSLTHAHCNDMPVHRCVRGRKPSPLKLTLMWAVVLYCHLLAIFTHCERFAKKHISAPRYFTRLGLIGSDSHTPGRLSCLNLQQTHSVFATNKSALYLTEKMHHTTKQGLWEFNRPWVIIGIQSLPIFDNKSYFIHSTMELPTGPGMNTVRLQLFHDPLSAHVLRVTEWVNSCHVYVCALSCTG